MAVFDGMRPGEILAIRVGRLKENSVHINQRVYRGTLEHRRVGRASGRNGLSDYRPAPSLNSPSGWRNSPAATQSDSCFRRRTRPVPWGGTTYGGGTGGRS